MKMKKIVAMLLAGTMLVTMAACGSSRGNETTGDASGDAAKEETTEASGDDAATDGGDLYTVRWVMPGNEPDELAAVEAALNEKLIEDGVGVQLDIVRIPWDAWSQKTNLMLTTGEEFGLLHIMQDQGAVMGQNVLLDLTNYLENYPNLKAKFTDQAWSEVTTKDNEIVAIPCAWRVPTPIGKMTIRSDIMRKLGLDLPQTPEEILDTAIKIKAEVEAQTGQKAYYWTQSTGYPAEWLERTYDTFPFYVDRINNLWKVDMEGNVSSWFESEEFKKDAQFYRQMYLNGLISPDLLTKNEVWEAGSKGTIVMGDSCYGNGDILAMREAGYEDADIEGYYLNSEKTKVIPLTIENMNGIPKSCSDPEAVLRFMDWFYGDAEHVQTLVNGIEGVHFNRVEGEPNRMETIKDKETDQWLYFFDNWEVGYYPYNLYNGEVPDSVIEGDIIPLEEGTYTVSPIAGFIFDESNVVTEMANLKNEVVASMYPIKFGFVEYDEAYDDAIAQLKAAGLDKVIEEYQRQLNEYLGK